MSMLADVRKKVKYSVNPRGTHWSNDEDKFGQKLMEKFGWQKGKGLGANEDGRVEHVKASGKNNTKGFGFKKTDSDNWICHQDDFNSLLSELNASHGKNDQKDEKVISLEEKSKSAKKRVHYHKQARGKDLSQRSSEDLDCIFGRKKSKIPKEEEVLQDGEETKANSEENTHGVQTIESNQSVQEYFAMKLAQMKSKRNSLLQEQLSDASQKEVMDQGEPAEVPVSEETSSANIKAIDSNEEKKENTENKKKKKKKSKEKERERQIKKDEEKEENSFPGSPLELGEKDEADSFEKNEDAADVNNCDEDCNESLSSKKMKKSKKKKRLKACVNNDTEPDKITQTIIEEVPITEDSKMLAGEVTLTTKQKKKKSDKKNKSEISEPDTSTAKSNILESSLPCATTSIMTNAETQDITLGFVSKETPVSVDDRTGIVENERTTRSKKSKKFKRIKEAEAVNTKAESDILDISVSFDTEKIGGNIDSLVDNNDEETIASPPKKKKKKKSSKKSKLEGNDQHQDADTADSFSESNKTMAPNQIISSLEMQNLDQGSESGSTHWGKLDDFNSLLKDYLHQIPESKMEVKKSPYAINTASKIFQKAGANVDKISGYGNTTK